MINIRTMRSDLKYLRAKYGELYDFCGAWCNCIVLEDILLEDSSTENIKYYIQSWIENYFIGTGYDVQSIVGRCITEEDIKEDIKLQEIVERYNI